MLSHPSHFLASLNVSSHRSSAVNAHIALVWLPIDPAREAGLRPAHQSSECCAKSACGAVSGFISKA